MPQRTFLRATGFDDAAMHKSIVGIVTTQGENTPCSMNLGEIGGQSPVSPVGAILEKTEPGGK